MLQTFSLKNQKKLQVSISAAETTKLSTKNIENQGYIEKYELFQIITLLHHICRNFSYLLYIAMFTTHCRKHSYKQGYSYFYGTP